MRKYRSSSNLVMVRWFLAELCPFYFENNMKFSVSVYYLPNSIKHSTQIWHIDTSKECAGQFQIWSWFDDFWQSYAPFTLKIIWNFQFPFYYLPNNITHSTQIWHMDMILECADQVWIWSWFNDFWQSNAPFTLKMIWNLQFLFIINPTVLHIQLKIDIWICQRNAQVKLEFGHGSMIFWQSYVPFTLKII